MLAPFLLACDPITPDPLVSSPDKILTDSVAVSAQVATGETVTYTFDLSLETTIYEINVQRRDGSNPVVKVCEVDDCSMGAVGVEFPDTNNIYDGSIIWYSATNAISTLYIFVGDVDGEEAKYSVSAGVESTTTSIISLTADDTYGVVNVNESLVGAEFNLTVAVDTDYTIDLNIDNGNADDMTLKLCVEQNCSGGNDPLSFVVTNPGDTSISGAYPSLYTGTLYVFVESTTNSIFHISGSED